MDCGDIGHILMSQEAAALLGNLHEWKEWVHDLGECEVKHGQRLRIFNFQYGDVGSRGMPRQIKNERIGRARSRVDIRKVVRLAALLAIGAAGWRYGPVIMPSVSASVKSAWRSVFKPKTNQLLREASDLSDERKWNESLAPAKAVLNAPNATPEQRAEAYYRSVSAYYHLNQTRRAAGSLRRRSLRTACRSAAAR